MTNYYKILDIEKDARRFTIKHSYRQKSIKYYPSKNKDLTSNKLFAKTIEAYEILSDKELRSQYNILYDKYFLNTSNQLAHETEAQIKDKLETAINSAKQKTENFSVDAEFIKGQVFDSIIADVSLEGFIFLLFGEVINLSFILGTILFFGGIVVAIKNSSNIIFVGLGLSLLGTFIIWYRLRQIRKGDG